MVKKQTTLGQRNPLVPEGQFLEPFVEKAPNRAAKMVQANKLVGRWPIYTVCVCLCACVCVYLPHDTLVMAGAEGGNDTHALPVPVQPLLTHAALRGAAAVDGRRVNVPAASLTQRGLLHAPPPLLAGGTRCRGERRDGWGAEAALSAVNQTNPSNLHLSDAAIVEQRLASSFRHLKSWMVSGATPPHSILIHVSVLLLI